MPLRRARDCSTSVGSRTDRENGTSSACSTAPAGPPSSANAVRTAKMALAIGMRGLLLCRGGTDRPCLASQLQKRLNLPIRDWQHFSQGVVFYPSEVGPARPLAIHPRAPQSCDGLLQLRFGKCARIEQDKRDTGACFTITYQADLITKAQAVLRPSHAAVRRRGEREHYGERGGEGKRWHESGAPSLQSGDERRLA